MTYPFWENVGSRDIQPGKWYILWPGSTKMLTVAIGDPKIGTRITPLFLPFFTDKVPFSDLVGPKRVPFSDRKGHFWAPFRPKRVPKMDRKGHYGGPFRPDKVPFSARKGSIFDLFGPRKKEWNVVMVVPTCSNMNSGALCR